MSALTNMLIGSPRAIVSEVRVLRRNLELIHLSSGSAALPQEHSIRHIFQPDKPGRRVMKAHST